MKKETVEEVRHMLCDFLDYYTDEGWDEDELYDLDSDIVSAVLKHEFQEAELDGDYAFLFDEEDAITDVECAVGKVTEVIDEHWSDERITIAAHEATAVAISKVKEVFKL